MKLLIGSHNVAKIKYYSQYLKDTANIVTLEELGITDDPEETEDTLEGNALLKAKYFYDLTGITTLSEDGGFYIDALNGEPGINTRRWIGRKMTDQEMIDETMKRMEGVPKEKRAAQFKLVTTIYGPKGSKNFYGQTPGFISEKPYPEIEAGFPHRSTFILPEYNKFYIELSKEEKEKSDHRIQIISEIKQYLKTLKT